MTPERWREVEAVFLAALERKPSTRPAFVDEACGSDPALRQEVESLLKAEAGASGFLEPPAAVPGHGDMEVDARHVSGAADLTERLQAAVGPAYEVERELGGGGMSRIFVATETALGRRVVIKVLPPELAEGVDAERFHREIRLAASLQHAHVVPVHSAGQGHGLLYYTMPFVEGESLRQRLEREGPLPVPEVMRLLREVTDALRYAHRSGVIHRDLKPANILLEEGHALITDFGIAKALSSAAGAAVQGVTLTSTGVVPGTPAYMAPEQAAGDPIDNRTDLYTLGCLAYELLTGRPPFTAASAQALIAAHLADEPEPVANRRPDMPRALAALVMRLLEKRREARPHSADEVLRALDTVEVGFHAGPLSGAIWTRRRLPVRVAILGLGFVLGLGVLFAWLHTRPEAEAGPQRVAVLPFENLGDTSMAYFADGITDEVRGKLAALPGLEVIARTSSAQYKRTPKSPQQIGQELGVRYLLTATVRWQRTPSGASRVRVSPELIEVRTAATTWQEPFDAALTDVFGVQTEIAGRVVQALGVALGAGERRRLAERPTDNLAAYDAYLKGEEVSRGATDPVTLRRAVNYYEQAIALDSTFALAWASLSQGLTQLYFNGTPSPTDAERSRVAAQRAIALAPDRPVGRLALGYYYQGVQRDNDRALREYILGLQLAPANPDLLFATATVEQFLGRWEAAAEHFRDLWTINPRSENTIQQLGIALLWLRRYPEALAVTDRGLSLVPTDLAALENKAMVHLAQGNLAGAQAVLQVAPKEVEPTALAAFFATYLDLFWVLDDEQQELLLRLTPGPFGDDRGAWGLALAATYAHRGDGAKARAYADSARVALEAQLKRTPENAETHALLGVALAYLGHHERAVREGRRGVELLPITKDAYTGAYIQHQLARIYLLVGDPEKTLDHLEPLLKLPYFLSPGWLRIDPMFDPLRDNPRFQRLVNGS